MTVLGPSDLLTAIRIPSTWSGAGFYFEKVADRNTWDFPLVNVASAMNLDGSGNIDAMRIACAGVQCTPRRLTTVEALVKGRRPDDETATLAGKTAVEGARPLNFNHFKIPLMENLVKRAVLNAATGTPTNLTRGSQPSLGN
jgi:xanthine dehydrogenase YagS FAD-binding subunit